MESRNDDRGSLSHANSSRAHNSMNHELPEGNYKAMVNEYCQKNYLPLPEYETDYPEDATGFVSVLTVCDKEYRSKPMAAKKKAEQNAAGKAALDIGLVKIDRDTRNGPMTSGASCTSGARLVDKSAVNGSPTSSMLGGESPMGSVSNGRFFARSAVPEGRLYWNLHGVHALCIHCICTGLDRCKNTISTPFIDMHDYVCYLPIAASVL